MGVRSFAFEEQHIDGVAEGGDKDQGHADGLLRGNGQTVPKNKDYAGERDNCTADLPGRDAFSASDGGADGDEQWGRSKNDGRDAAGNAFFSMVNQRIAQTIE